MSTSATQEYYYAGGKRVDLHRDARLFAVRFRPGRRDDDEALSTDARRLLTRTSRNVGTLRSRRIHLYEVTDEDPVDDTGATTEGRVSGRVARLAGEPAVEFTAPVLRRSPQDPDPIIPTPDILVGFLPEVTEERRDALFAEFGLRIRERLGYHPHGFAVTAPEVEGPHGSLVLANRLYASRLTEFAMPDLIRRHHSRTAGSDAPSREQASDALGYDFDREARSTRSGGDLRSDQWHLDTIDIDGAWQITRGSRDIVVAVLDDGFDLAHPEFQGSGKLLFQYDFEDDDTDATPSFDDEMHGTACAGVAVARGVRAFGSAPGCALMALRTPFEIGVSEEARMFQRAADEGADVISCSWGPTDGAGTVDPLPDPTRAAMDHCVEHGRGGLGIPIFFAAGNGSESVSDDGYASHHRVIAVAASTSEEGHAWYSDTGPEVDVAAPSNGGQKGITTTDRRGAIGYNPGSVSFGDATGDYTNDFGGTSSATPLTAGVAALVLSVAPQLRWDEVKAILEETADQIGGTGEYDAHGHSDRFGRGRINARAAVERARTLAGSVGGSVGGSGGVAPTTGPSVRLPAEVARDGGPPSILVDAAGRASMAVELATEASLFGGGTRESSNFYPLWEQGEDSTVGSAPNWSVPSMAWARLRHAERLFVRVHVADDPATWSNYDVSTPDTEAAHAPAIRIAAASPSTPTGGAGPSSGTGAGPSTGTGTGPGPGTSVQGQVHFPSGASFDIVTAPGDGVDYHDPVANGLVPLIAVAGRTEERLAANFQVKEFAARRVGGRTLVDHSRISSKLVEGLQELRERVGRGITITSGYRYPALNADAGGASASQHMAGRAVDMKASGMRPLELAEEALAVLGADIGIGLGANIIHVDLREDPASWTYSGAELDEADFDAWVRERRGTRSNRGRSEAAPLDGWPAVDAPSTCVRGAGAPVLRVRPGQQPFWGLEIAADREALADPTSAGPHQYWRSWDTHLTASGDTEWHTVTLPTPVWEAMREAAELRYRAFTSADPQTPVEVRFSTFTDEPDATPAITLRTTRARDTQLATLEAGIVKRRDESLWRR